MAEFRDKRAVPAAIGHRRRANIGKKWGKFRSIAYAKLQEIMVERGLFFEDLWEDDSLAEVKDQITSEALAYAAEQVGETDESFEKRWWEETDKLRAQGKELPPIHSPKPAISDNAVVSDERGLMQRLQEKSGDELKKIEESMNPEQKGLLQESVPEEDPEKARIMERIRMFREGKDPDAEGVGVLQQGEFDEFALVGDPMMHHLQGEYAATPQEERQLAKVIGGASEFVFGDRMSAVIKNLRAGTINKEDGSVNRQGEELYEKVSRTAFEILKKQKSEIEKSGEKAEPAVFFAETGAVPAVVDMVWDLAKQVDLPGSDDQDQYAGALINVMRLAGEQIAASGDDEAIEEAEELMTTMAMTNPDGSMMETPEFAASVENEGLRRTALAGGINEALLGGVS